MTSHKIVKARQTTGWVSGKWGGVGSQFIIKTKGITRKNRMKKSFRFPEPIHCFHVILNLGDVT